MPKKRKGLPRDEPAGSQDEVELTGAVVDGELYLRDPDGRVYAAERDDSGGLVQVGTWDDGAVRPLPPPPAAHLRPAAAAQPACRTSLLPAGAEVLRRPCQHALSSGPTGGPSYGLN